MQTLSEKVLNYWHTIETLTPVEFPKIEKTKDLKNRKSVRIEKYIYKDFSWKNIDYEENLKEIFPEISDEFDYCVGKIPKKEIIKSFFAKLDKVDDRIEDEEGDICLFGFQVDNQGNYGKDSFSLSPFIWSVANIISNREVDETDYKNELKNQEYLSILESDKKIEDKIKILFGILKERYLGFICNHDEILMDSAMFFSRFADKEEKVIASEKIQHESSFMNSFLLADLELVENHHNNSLVEEYIEILNNENAENRINITDAETNRDEIEYILSYKKMPMAKWPGKFSPALMQQIAINYVCSGEYPLFSVNGPPGSGKTTLLKEIIAQKIYETALEISKFENAKDAFTEKEITTQNIDAPILKKWYKPNEILTNFGILVCSCNNAAVENISLELPSYDGMVKNIDGKNYKSFFDSENAYFTKTANKLFKIKEQETGKNCGKACGLISVPLGKQKNISDFTYAASELIYRSNDLIEQKINTNDFQKAKKEFLEQKDKVSKLLEKYKGCVTNEFLGRLENGDKKCQIENPWGDKNLEELNTEREILFIKSLNLRKEFILSSKEIRNNMKVLFHIWGKKDDKYKDIFFSDSTKFQIFNDLFQTLFLVVPVISSTFASVSRFLKYINEPKKIGLLIVDEAGQATPQNAVGALYRAKQAVIVGDPMQVEPVVTFPKYFNEVIGKDKEIEKYLSQKESVQTFADRLNPIGSYLKNSSDEKTWVGCPLIVHRRCIEPMFSISNELSYNSTMINETGDDKSKNALFDLSYWFDISGTDDEKNHSVEEQAQFVVDTIQNKYPNNKNKIYVISPFTTVIRRIESLLNEKGIKGIECGTVHRFQGKEAEEVFFVLGCSNKTKRAVDWVNSNIVNVAVTRAKYRLYIVGDFLLWKQNLNLKLAQSKMDLYTKNENFELQNNNNSMSQKISNFINNEIKISLEYNVLVTENLYLLKTKQKCWKCKKTISVFAIVAKKFAIKKDDKIDLHYSDSFVIFKNITAFDSNFEKAISDYKTLRMENKYHKYLMNTCEHCNSNQTEQYLFSNEIETTTFGKDINENNFEVIEIKLGEDVQFKGKIFNFLF